MRTDGHSRRAFLRGIATAAATAAMPGWTQTMSSNRERPDVLFIAIEDVKTCFGCYGHPICRTPNLDAFARSGVRFDNAQCQAPVCNPTRSSMLTGLYPSTTKVFGNSQDWNEYIPLGTSMPEYFRAHGYRTLTVGKIFHAGSGGRDFDAKARWDEIIPERRDIEAPKTKEPAPPPTYLYDRLTPEEQAKEYDTRAWVWGPKPGGDLARADGCVAEQAVRVLSKPRQAGDAPIFFGVGFHLPHLPLFAPTEYFEMYPPERIPLPEYPEDDLDDCVNKYSKKNHEAFTPEKMREAIAAYYACVSFMDAQAGRVLTALEDSGRAENTIVVVWGDHGFHLGEHMLWQKYTAFEESCRVPLLIRAPGVTPQSVWCSRPVECLDLFPTLTDLCGLGVPENIEGVSMKELLATPEMPWKKAALTEMPNVISLRSEQFRYVRSRSDPSREELYDHERDPREIHNVARDMEYDYVLAEMRGYAEGGWKSRLPG